MSTYEGGDIGPPEVVLTQQTAYLTTPTFGQSSAYALAPPDSPRSISIKGAAQRQKPDSPVKLERTPEPDWQEIPYVEEGAYTRGFAVAQDVLDAYVDTRGPFTREARIYPHQPSAYNHEGSNFNNTQFIKQEPRTEIYPQRPKQAGAYPKGQEIALDVFDTHVNARGPVATEARAYPYQLDAHKYEGPNSYNTQFSKQEPGTETYPQPREQPEAYPKGYAVALDVNDTHPAARDPEAYRQPRTQGRGFPYILLYIPLIYNQQ